jgi:hypothetical protein
MEIRNATVEDVRIEIEDHGILTAWLFLDYGNCEHQGFGGYAFDRYDSVSGCRKGVAFGSEFILQCLKICDVFSWHHIKGKNIRVKSEDGVIKEIGHITKDLWFNPKEVAKNM